jgi:hypothetical protein
MSSDAGSRQPDDPKADFRLPELVDVRTRRIDFEPPRHRHFESDLAQYQEAVEFVVVTDGPIPIRSLGAALFVGDTALTEVSPVDENSYRFVAFRPNELHDGAGITLGWTGQVLERGEPRFFYQG